MAEDIAEAFEERRTELARLDQIQRESDLETLMRMPEGRRFFWRVLDEVTGLHGGSFTGDALTSAFNEGKRAVGRALALEAQRVCPNHYVTMERERLQELDRRLKEGPK